MPKLAIVLMAWLTPAVLGLLALTVLLPPVGMAATPLTRGAVISVPVAGGFPIACADLALTQGYGPATVRGEPNDFHHGWDLACPAGTLVVSVTSGRAHIADPTRGGGYGNNVQVHSGDLWIRYAHMELILVADGDEVAPGTALGLEGSTGFSTGPHLHFEVDGPCEDWPCSIDPGRLIGLPAGVA